MNTPVSPKVTSATVVGAIVTLIVWFADTKNVTIPAIAQGAITTILMAVAGWLTPDQLRIVGQETLAKKGSSNP